MQVINRNGFTLVELVTIILLLSIIAVVSFARLGDTSAFEDRGFYDRTANALRYAQKLAVASGCEVQFTFVSNGYSLNQHQTDCTSGAFTRAVPDPVNRSADYSITDADLQITLTGQTLPFNVVFTADSEIDGIASNQVVTVNGINLTLIRLTGLVDAI
jgi:MSHA pilin protein MshC